MTLNNTDTLLVNRGSNSYSIAAENLMATLEDTDLMLVNRSGQSYKATGKEIIDSVIDPLGVSASVSPFDPDSQTTLSVVEDVSGGKAPFTVTYQWKYKTAADPTIQTIGGAEAQLYQTTASDIGRMLACEVTVTDSRSTSVSTLSNFTNAVVQDISINQPQVVSPPDGSGVGGPITYQPSTSEITNITMSGQGAFLTFADEDVYNADTGVNVGSPISEVFTTGLKIGGIKDGEPTANGTVVSDAVGNTVSVLASTSENFTGVSAAEQFSWIPLTYGNGTFVSLAGGGTYATKAVMYSTNAGLSWNSANASTKSQWKGVAYGDNKFVGVGRTESRRFMYSADGKDWSHQGVTGPDQDNLWSCITYGGTPGNEVFVALSHSGSKRVVYSSDGISWQEGDIAEKYWNGIGWGGAPGEEKFVAVAWDDGSGNKSNMIAYSADGITWTSVDGPNDTESTYRSVVWGDDKWVATTGKTTSTSKKNVAYSADGITWINSGLTGLEKNNSWTSVTHGNGWFVAVAREGNRRVKYSHNGINWTSQISPSTNSQWNCITYAKDLGRYVAVASTGTLRTFYGDDFGGPFIDGMKVVSINPITEYGPSAGSLKFVSDIPSETPIGEINTWGVATWEVSTDSGFTSPMFGATVIQPGINQTLEADERGDIVLLDDTDYWARVSYSSLSPSTSSAASNPVHFKTRPTVRATGTPEVFYSTHTDTAITGDDIVNQYGMEPTTANLSQLGIAELTEQPSYPVAGYQAVGDKYKPIEDQSADLQIALGAYSALAAQLVDAGITPAATLDD